MSVAVRTWNLINIKMLKKLLKNWSLFTIELLFGICQLFVPVISATTKQILLKNIYHVHYCVKYCWLFMKTHNFCHFCPTFPHLIGPQTSDL
jgi:hypothetical protein